MDTFINTKSDKKINQKFKDKKHLLEITNTVRQLKSVGGILNYVETLYPGWILGIYDSYDSKELNESWQKTLDKLKRDTKRDIKKQKIILVDFILFDNNYYTNINYFADVLTKCGFSVIDKTRAQESPNNPKSLIRTSS